MKFANVFQIVCVTIVSLTSSIPTGHSLDWTCSKDGNALPLRPKEMAGTWYEIIRFPSSEVPACVQVIAPESQVDAYYTLELDYINNVNKGWKPTKESLVFPWSEAKRGRFNLLYSNDDVNITVRFKYLGSLRGYSVVCGYTDIASSISIIRILSRHRQLNSTTKETISALANQFQVPLADFTLVEQDARCNGSNNLPLFHVGVMLCFLLCATVWTEW